MLRWQLHSFELPLVSPIVVAGQTQEHRRGLLLHLHDGERWGCGEISPLPGLHVETLKQCELHLPALEAALADAPQPADLLDRFLLNHACYERLGTPASLCFGLDMATAQLWSMQHRRPWTTALAKEPSSRVPIQALLWGDLDEMLSQVQPRVAQGYRAFKIKIGRGPVERELAFLRRFRQRVPEATTLRLDANRRLEWEQALAYAEAAEELAVEYIEEPLCEPQRMSEFVEATGCPVAWDESAEGPAPDALPSHLSAVVLKPQTLGGWVHNQAWVERAHSAGIPAVLSSCFESDLGLGFLAQWASLWPPTPIGLDTHRWFPHDRLVMFIRAGALHLDGLQDWLHQSCRILPKVCA